MSTTTTTTTATTFATTPTVLVNGKICNPETVAKIQALENSTLARAGMLIISNKPVRNDKHFNDMKKLELLELADALVKNTKCIFTSNTREYFYRLYTRITGFNGVSADLPIVTPSDIRFLYSSLQGSLKRSVNGVYDIPTEFNITFTAFEKTVDLLCFALATNSMHDFFNSAYTTASEAERAKIKEKQAKAEAKAKAKADKKKAEDLKKLEAMKKTAKAKATKSAKNTAKNTAKAKTENAKTEATTK